MRSCVILLTAAVALACCPDGARADACAGEDNTLVADGGCWNSLSDNEKAAVVLGIWVGKTTRRLADNLIDEHGRYFYKLDHASTNSATDIGHIVDYFDRLYSYSINLGIQWEYAYLLAALYTRDDDENDRLNLLRFLRRYGRLPTFGSVVRAVRPDLLILSTDAGRFEFKLAGVSAEGLSEEATVRASAFIDSLTSSAFASCASTRPANFTIVYSDEFFSKDNLLTGYLALKDVYLCSEDKETPVSALADDDTGLHLNSFLVQHGLAEPEPVSDHKWSGERQTIRRFWTTFRTEGAGAGEPVDARRDGDPHAQVELIGELLGGYEQR